MTDVGLAKARFDWWSASSLECAQWHWWSRPPAASATRSTQRPAHVGHRSRSRDRRLRVGAMNAAARAEGLAMAGLELRSRGERGGSLGDARALRTVPRIALLRDRRARVCSSWWPISGGLHRFGALIDAASPAIVVYSAIGTLRNAPHRDHGHPRLGLPDAAIRAARRAGFGVLAEIDIAAVFQAKVGVDAASSDPRRVQPGLRPTSAADRPERQLLLPCNVTVERSKVAPRSPLSIPWS